MKISDYSGDEALDLVADLIEPFVEIMSDKEVLESAKNGSNAAKTARIVIKSHKSAITQIMARIDGVPVDQYKVNVLTLPAKVIEIFTGQDVLSLFQSAEPAEEPRA